MSLNSNHPDFDWHEPGIWIAVHPEDGPDTQFVSDTPITCRDEMRIHGVWSAAWVIQKLVPEAEPVLHLREQVTSNEGRWRYPANDEPAPSGDVLLLTVGRITVVGTWTNDGRFIAWAPKIQRDKELERRLGL
jgi:hypothetical protein